ncbi:hypothetical protein C8R45DRAFT_1108007 [Mycena sanguinolenta]|nr:hypothetical protein C8R45DRAFT_1108007 [Mycena sanguinolenta]
MTKTPSYIQITPLTKYRTALIGAWAFYGNICDQSRSNPQGLCNNIYIRANTTRPPSSTASVTPSTYIDANAETDSIDYDNATLVAAVDRGALFRVFYFFLLHRDPPRGELPTLLAASHSRSATTTHSLAPLPFLAHSFSFCPFLSRALSPYRLLLLPSPLGGAADSGSSDSGTAANATGTHHQRDAQRERECGGGDEFLRWAVLVVFASGMRVTVAAGNGGA